MGRIFADVGPRVSFLRVGSKRVHRRAADLLDVDIALINLVGADRQWARSAGGLEAQEADVDTETGVGTYMTVRLARPNGIS